MKRDTNTHYEWPSGSAVTQVDVRTQKNGQSVAYLYADPAAPKDTLLEIRSALRLKGWGTLSDNRDGKFSLRVSGVRREIELIEILKQVGAATSTPTITHSTTEEPKAKNLVEFVRNNSLTISGVIATVGNALSTASGFARGKDVGQIGQGLAFAVADLPLAVAGGRDDNRQFTNLLRQLKKHYDKNGIEIPKNAAILVEVSDKGKGIGERTQDYLHRYANQIKCSMEVVAAGFTIQAGKTQGSSFKKYAPYFWGSGFLASLLIPEKKIDEQKYAEAGTLGRAWMNIQAHPLSIGGLLGYTNTVASYGSAINEKKTQSALKASGKPSTTHYRWDFAIPTVMIGANGTYAISKKTVGGDIKTTDMVSDVYRIASQIINKLPESERERALESTAKFLGERPEVSDTRAQVREKLVTQMTIQRQNPWFENITLPARTKSASPAPSLVQAPQAAPKPTIDATNATHIAKGVAENPQLEHATAR